MARRLLLALALGGGVLLACCVGWIHLNSRDVPPPDDGVLRLQRSGDPGDGAALRHLRRASALIAWPDERWPELRELATGGPWDAGVARELLERNREALDELEAAESAGAIRLADVHLERPDSLAFNPAFEELWSWAELAHVRAVRARSRFRKGQRAEAFRDALGVVRLGHRIEGAGGSMLHYSTGRVVKGPGLVLLAKFARHTPRGAPLLRDASLRLGQFRVNQPGFAGAFEAEYHFVAGGLDLAFEGEADVVPGAARGDLFSRLMTELPDAYALHPNRTKLALILLFTGLQQDALRPCGDMPHYPAAAASRPAEGAGAADLYLEPNAAGRVVLEWVPSAFGRFLRDKCDENVQVDATRTLLALRAFQLTRGALPQSLEQLVPDYLGALPIDDFDGLPLRYSRERGLLWSVGADLVDAGGRSGDGSGSDDAVFPIDF